ncbi:MAG: hypothetical protein M0027_08630, partial [Candidatus Dormibacteraeota bacterium]|nr:hypothetical protein [Candidatus Dormibacteraeota bacterium]
SYVAAQSSSQRAVAPARVLTRQQVSLLKNYGPEPTLFESTRPPSVSAIANFATNGCWGAVRASGRTGLREGYQGSVAGPSARSASAVGHDGY